MDAHKRIPAAASSALPGRWRGMGLGPPAAFGGPPPGIPSAIVLPPTVIVSPAALFAVRRVSMRPYATVFARTPKMPHSLAIVLNSSEVLLDSEHRSRFVGDGYNAHFDMPITAAFPCENAFNLFLILRSCDT